METINGETKESVVIKEELKIEDGKLQWECESCKKLNVWNVDVCECGKNRK